MFDIQVTSSASFGTITQLLPRPEDPLLTAKLNPRVYSEFIQIMKDANGNAEVWGNHMVAVVSTSVIVPDAVIDACVKVTNCNQNHNEQAWMWIRMDAGLEVDAVVPRTDYERLLGVWSGFCNGGPANSNICGCNHFTTDLTSGGTNFACGFASSYPQQGANPPPDRTVTSPLQFPGSPAFPTVVLDGSAKATGSVKLQ